MLYWSHLMIPYFSTHLKGVIAMSRKVIVVGGVAGGASAAARLRRLEEDAQITVYERGPDASFSNCSLPFLLSGVVPGAGDLIMITPEKFKNQYNLDVCTRHEVVEIDRAGKRVRVKDLSSGRDFWDGYDQLILAPGANPLLPPIQGLDTARVFTVKDVKDIRELDAFLRQGKIKELAVVGGGFIGLEVAENLCLAGVRVTLVEAQDQVMAPLDYDMAQTLHKVLYDHGVELILGDGVKRLMPDGLELTSGRKVSAPGVVMALGVRPEVTLAKQCGLELGETGGILVDQCCRTSDPSIFAVGDAIEVRSMLTGRPMRLTQAGPAQKEARAAADSICGRPDLVRPFLGSSVIKLFDWTAACTGLNEKTARAAGVAYDFVYVLPGDRVGLMPGAQPVQFKLLYQPDTGKVLGAQAISRGAADKRIDVVATLIAMGGTLEDLKNLELCYAPMYGTAKDVVNYAALVALNVKQGVFRQVPVTAVRGLVAQKACIVDVREAAEYEAGHIVGAVNIPLSQLRARTAELHRDRPVYLHCRTSQRSYNAIMALQGMGWDNLYNISGSFVGLSYYEFFNDQVTDRERILTAYNFN